MKLDLRIAFAALLLNAACGGVRPDASKESAALTPAAEENIVKEKTDAGKELLAVLKISHGGAPLGEVVVKLFPNEAPVTVENFTALAKGDKMFLDPKTREQVKRPFFNGLTFHRIIKNFMIQGGCPIGNGTGGPGYRFQDEFAPGLTFARPGLLAMANSGPGTNGSQFFITTVPTPWLNNRHTIFGEVIEGMDVVKKIEAVPTGAGDRPVKAVVLEEVLIK